VIGEHFRYGRFSSHPVLQHIHDAPVYGPPLGLNHGFVRHPLQQGMPEVVADFRAHALRHQNLRLDERFQPLANLRLVLEQGEQKIQGERAVDAGCGLGDAPRPRPSVQPFRHQLGEHERHASQSAVWRRPARLLIQQRNDELLEEERHPLGGLDGLQDHFVGQPRGPRNRPRKLQAVLQPQMLETNRLVDFRKSRTLGKGPHGQHHENRQFRRSGDDVT
jgi:hypothetical protein